MKTVYLLSLAVSALAVQANIDAQAGTIQERLRARAGAPSAAPQAPAPAAAVPSKAEVEEKINEMSNELSLFSKAKTEAEQSRLLFGVNFLKQALSHPEVKTLISKAVNNPQLEDALKEVSRYALEKLKANKDLMQYVKNIATSAQQSM